MILRRPSRSGAGRNQHRWYNYGSYNLTNEYGERRVVNCQWGGARVRLCYGYGGSNCAITIPAGHVWEGSITPINVGEASPLEESSAKATHADQKGRLTSFTAGQTAFSGAES